MASESSIASLSNLIDPLKTLEYSEYDWETALICPLTELQSLLILALVTSRTFGLGEVIWVDSLMTKERKSQDRRARRELCTLPIGPTSGALKSERSRSSRMPWITCDKANILRQAFGPKL
jgi:hypothetical protein